MWIVCLADDSHEMLNFFTLKTTKKKKKKKKSECLLQLWLVYLFLKLTMFSFPAGGSENC